MNEIKIDTSPQIKQEIISAVHVARSLKTCVRDKRLISSTVRYDASAIETFLVKKHHALMGSQLSCRFLDGVNGPIADEVSLVRFCSFPPFEIHH